VSRAVRILLLSLYFAPDIAANAVIMTGLAEELEALGHQVTVVTAFPHYARNVIDARYRGHLVQQDKHKGMRVIRVYLYASPEKQRFLVRLLNYVSFNVLSTLAGIWAGSQDIILAPSPPLTIGLSAWLISRLKGIGYIYNVQDIYPDIAIRLGVLTLPVLIRFSYWMEKFVYSKAAAVTVLSECFRQNLLAKGVPAEKLTVIPNFVDEDFIRPLPKDNVFSRRHNLHNRFVVMYAGNIGLSQGLETLLQAARILQDLANLQILIVGNGSAKQSLEIQAQAMGLTNVEFLPFQPCEALPEMYATADVSLVLLKRGIGAESVPSKAYTILASGRPLIAAVDEQTETWQLVVESHCGIAVLPQEAQTLADAIRQLYHAPVARVEMGQRGRAYVSAHYTPQAVAAQYDALLKRVVTKSTMT
jgi:colanic acid biosynthesis glycosyl transferase WcaI